MNPVEVTRAVDQLDDKHAEAVLETLLRDPNVQRAMRMRCELEGCRDRNGVGVVLDGATGNPRMGVTRTCEWCGR